MKTNTCWTHHILMFLAGAAFWEALVHLSLQYSGLLPLDYYGFTLTTSYNMFAIGGAALLSVVLLWFACRCEDYDAHKRHDSHKNH